ncbi:hypothetical protein KIW84_012694 [Lathyrus oleraceus]|uniref:Uncharacterized protein n=1 Tax=Pisum sativum TaxID=3888 RepID=A0A9D5BIE9_PEA|nr:hypothetical protein KIW84_012694 [Pisum sativum]
MTYAELYPSLIDRKLINPRDPPAVPTNPPWWYKLELLCVYHFGAPGYDVENCYPLKTKVQDLVRSGILFFEDIVPNVKKNPLPEHGKEVVNMVQGCPGKYKVLYVNDIRQSLVEMHKLLCEHIHYEHDHDRCQYDGSKKKVSPALMIKPAGPVPYVSDKVVPYRYNAVMLKDGKEVPFPLTFVVSILDVSGVTHSGRVFSAQPKSHEDIVKRTVVNPADPSGILKEDGDEMLRLIKMSEYNVIDQLLQTPSKIFVLSLLMNSEPHREALKRVLDEAYVDHDVTIEQFDSVTPQNLPSSLGTSLTYYISFFRSLGIAYCISCGYMVQAILPSLDQKKGGHVQARVSLDWSLII